MGFVGIDLEVGRLHLCLQEVVKVASGDILCNGRDGTIGIIVTLA